MRRPMNVVEALERVGRRLQATYGDRPIPRKVLRDEAVRECGCSPGSGLPSDFCYNRTNNGIHLENTPMFIHEERGLYRFVGRGFCYTGKLMHYPMGGLPRQVGEWVNGVLTFTG